MLNNKAAVFSVTAMVIALIATSMWFAGNDDESADSLNVDSAGQVDQLIESSDLESNGLPRANSSAAGERAVEQSAEQPGEDFAFESQNASNRIVAERVIGGPEYAEASIRAAEMFNASNTLVVLRSEIVRLDLDAVERLLDASRNQQDGFSDSFELSVFGEEPCVVSQSSGISHNDLSGMTIFALRCEDSSTDVSLYEGNKNLLLRFVGRDGSDVRLTPIVGPDLFVAYEVTTDIAGPKNY